MMAESLKYNFMCILFIMFFCNFLPQICSANYEENKVMYLLPGEKFECCKTAIELTEFRIFCYKGQPVHLLHMFQSAFIELEFESEKYDLYEGNTVEEVQQQYARDQSSWSLSLWGSPKRRELQLKPFNETCVGVSTRQKFSLRLLILRISYYRLIALGAGLLLFLAAPRLGRNVAFHYMGGISLGVLASFLVLVFLISRMLPKKPVVYTMLAGGWMVSIYMLNLAWDNLRHLLTEYKTHLSCYIALSATISFIVCYRMGPVTNPRTMDIIQWILQAIGLALMLLSSHFQEATVGIVILVLTVYNIPRTWTARMGLFWHRCFPPRQKLLTLAEYEQQGAAETEKALLELRQYCSTPESNPWKLQLQLKNPARFARFVQGESHLSDDELMEYDVVAFNTSNVVTDDDSDY